MGLPTITEFFGEYLDFLPENPFITCDINSLKDTIIKFIKNVDLLKEYSENGRKWVEKYHSYEAVNKRVEELYTEYGI
jgi:glycosyltransferase involved in cell wall biosynthesis